MVIIGEHIQLKIGKPGQVCWSASLTVIINFEYVHCTIVENKCFRFQYTKMLLVQSQKWKQTNHLWNLFKVNDRYQNDVNDVALVFLLLTLSRFHTFSGISTVDIKLVKTDWEISVVQKLTRSYRFTKANVKLISSKYLFETWISVETYDEIKSLKRFLLKHEKSEHFTHKNILKRSWNYI